MGRLGPPNAARDYNNELGISTMEDIQQLAV
jgi:hypothetical protein